MEKKLPTFTRHLKLLLTVQSLAGSTSAVSLLVSGFIGTSLAPIKSLATLPMSAFVVGVAASSGVATWVMSRIGRRKGHLLGAGIALTGTFFAGSGLHYQSFWGYCAACVLLGSGTAFNNQVRFTAAEAAPQEEKALVHSAILMCGLFAAILGPGIAAFGRHLVSDSNEYVGSYALLTLVLLLAISCLLFLPTRPSEAATVILPSEPKPSAATVLKRSEFWLGAVSGTTSFAVMTLLMSATPMQMTMVEHFSHDSAIFTIQSHIVAMFFPSLFGGILVSKLGIRRLIALGISLYTICIPIAFFAGSLHDYWWALVLLGVGWNFLFLAGSTTLSLNFSGADRFAAQGLNDTLVFGTQAIASLSAGWLLYTVGWKTLALVPIPFLLILSVVVWMTIRRK